jgi:Flp pilus assembly protein TadD
VRLEDLKALASRALQSEGEEDLERVSQAISQESDAEVLRELGSEFYTDTQISFPAFRRACQLLPSSVRALTDLGTLLWAFGGDDEARVWLERARQVDPHAIATLQLDATLERDASRRRALLLEILELDPENESAKQNLSYPVKGPPR